MCYYLAAMPQILKSIVDCMSVVRPLNLPSIQTRVCHSIIVVSSSMQLQIASVL